MYYYYNFIGLIIYIKYTITIINKLYLIKITIIIIIKNNNININ